MDALVKEWRRIIASLEEQLIAFDPPRSMRIGHNGRDTTEESKRRITKAISEFRALLDLHDA
jgi:hypothetical protein